MNAYENLMAAALREGGTQVATGGMGTAGKNAQALFAQAPLTCFCGSSSNRPWTRMDGFIAQGSGSLGEFDKAMVSSMTRKLILKPSRCASASLLFPRTLVSNLSHSLC